MFAGDPNFTILADPTNTDFVYIAGTTQPCAPNPVAGTANYGGRIYRGSRYPFVNFLFNECLHPMHQVSAELLFILTDLLARGPTWSVLAQNTDLVLIQMLAICLGTI